MKTGRRGKVYGILIVVCNLSQLKLCLEDGLGALISLVILCVHRNPAAGSAFALKLKGLTKSIREVRKMQIEMQAGRLEPNTRTDEPVRVLMAKGKSSTTARDGVEMQTIKRGQDTVTTNPIASA